jgi:hypothetical protein
VASCSQQRQQGGRAGLEDDGAVRLVPPCKRNEVVERAAKVGEAIDRVGVEGIQDQPYAMHRESFSASALGAQQRHKQRKFTVPVEQIACAPAPAASDGAEETAATNTHTARPSPAEAPPQAAVALPPLTTPAADSPSRASTAARAMCRGTAS